MYQGREHKTLCIYLCISCDAGVQRTLVEMYFINLGALFLTRDRQAGPEWCKYLFHIKFVNGTNNICV